MFLFDTSLFVALTVTWHRTHEEENTENEIHRQNKSSFFFGFRPLHRNVSVSVCAMCVCEMNGDEMLCARQTVVRWDFFVFALR